MSLQVRVSENEQTVFEGQTDLPLELGRQADRLETPYTLKRGNEQARVIVARLEEYTVSRRHALLEVAPDNHMRITNLSAQQPINVVEGRELPPHDSCIMP